METTAGAHRVAGLAESQTLAMAKKVRELRAAGKKVISLTLGEPDFDTPDHIRAAAIKSIEEGFTHYPPVAGIPELREGVANYFRQQHQLPYNAENIIISTGAKQSLVNAIMAIVNPGDEVIIPAPYWVSYLPMVKMAEGIPVIVNCGVEQEYKIRPEQLEAAITPKTKLFIFNSPSNPTGMMYTPEEIKALVNILAAHPSIFIISDEIYELIRFEKPHVSIGSFAEVFEQTITINGVSKAFAMTGWRVGFTGAPKWLAALCERYQGQVTSGTCSIAQRAALAAVTGSLEPAQKMVSKFRERRDFCVDFIRRELPNLKLVVPDGAFYLYLDVSYYLGRYTPEGALIEQIDQLVDYILEVGQVATVSGSAFGTQSHLRISTASSQDTLWQGLTQLQECLSKI
jgi:aspartate aminotransferase